MKHKPTPDPSKRRGLEKHLLPFGLMCLLTALVLAIVSAWPVALIFFLLFVIAFIASLP